VPSRGACHTLATVGCLLLSKHIGGGGITPAFSDLLVYLQFPWGVPLPPSGGAFHRTTTFTSFPCSKVAGQGPPFLPSLASLFVYSLGEGVLLLHSPELRVPRPLFYLSFFFFFFFSAACLLLSFFVFSFFPGLGSVCPGGYADLSQGVPPAIYLLTWWSPKQGRSWRLALQEPSWFLHLKWLVGGAMCGLGVWRCPSFASSWWFSVSPRVYFRKHAFCFLPLVTILESF
jgi:hypothetical protein